MPEDKYFEMTIDGKKTKVSERQIMAQGTRDKKIPVEINGRIVRIMPHMLDDIKKFGGMEQRKVIKEPPKELLMPLPKKLVLPRSEPLIKEEVISEVVPPVVPPVVESTYPGEEVKAVVETPETEQVTPPVSTRKVVRKPTAKKK